MTSHSVALIVMLGPHRAAPGGISTVLRIYQQSGLDQSWPVVYWATWREHQAAWRGLASAMWLKGQRVLDALGALMQLLWMLHRKQVQAVHAHSAARGSFWRKSILLQCARMYGRPTLLHIHDGTFVQWYERLNGFAQRAVRGSLKRATCVIVLTPFWARAIGQIQPQAHITILPNPVNVAPLIQHNSQHSHKRDGTILFMGRLWPEKGVIDLLEAVAALQNRFPKIQLVLAGDGDLPAIQSQAQALGITDRVQLPGWVANQQKQTLLHQATVLVLPSMAEGMPMAVLEAMAAGIPVIASAVGGIPDMLARGGGMTYPAGNSFELMRLLEYLLSKPDQARQIGARGYKVAQSHYAAHQVMAQLGALYQQLGLRY